MYHCWIFIFPSFLARSEKVFFFPHCSLLNSRHWHHVIQRKKYIVKFIITYICSFRTNTSIFIMKRVLSCTLISVMTNMLQLPVMLFIYGKAVSCAPCGWHIHNFSTLSGTRFENFLIPTLFQFLSWLIAGCLPAGPWSCIQIQIEMVFLKKKCDLAVWVTLRQMSTRNCYGK